MGLDLADLRRAVAREGRVVRVVVGDVRGSAPREAGAAMLVWDGGQSGTIGGGALEFEAAARARRLDADAVTRHALGPDLGQCCGGAVTLVFQIWEAARLDEIDGAVVARPVPGAGAAPLEVTRILARARAEGVLPAPGLVGGWMVEPVARPARQVWIWGAGHVGRALVGVLAPLPDLALTWIDTAPERFPADPPAGVACLPATRPETAVRLAPKDAEHLVLTYSHALDLAICDALLGHGFASAGLIGSATKRARFRKRLADAGHPPARIAEIACPIGDKGLGKHPQAIAIGVAQALLRAAPARAAGSRSA